MIQWCSKCQRVVPVEAMHRLPAGICKYGWEVYRYICLPCFGRLMRGQKAAKRASVMRGNN